MEKRNFSYGSFFKGLAIGGALASVVVLFTAPSSGAETRKLLQDKSVELRERSMSMLEDAIERMDTKLSDTLDQAELTIQRLGRQVDVISHQSQPSTESN